MKKMNKKSGLNKKHLQKMKNLTKLSIQGLFALLFGLLLACGGNQAKKEEGKPGQQMEESKPSAKKYILFFGNSLTAGYGIDISEAFPALIQKRMDSLGLNFTVVNSGVSGETTATGVNRVDWVVSQTPPDIFVLELGGNDGLRGIPVTETKKNLVAIIDKVRQKNPDVEIILAGMMVPPNMGPKYSKEFLEIYPSVAKAKKVRLIPFLLDKVGGEKELNLEDGIHPTEDGHKIVAETVWGTLKDVLK
jgi:acyl-CoA thioesterase-1